MVFPQHGIKKLTVGVLVGVAALVEKLKVAGVDGEGLVSAGADEFTVADIVGPGGTAVGLAGEGVLLGASLLGPLAVEGGGGVRAEVTAVVALGLDDHEVLVQALESVNLDGLEDPLGSVADDGGSLGEVAGEAAKGHAGAVDLAVVTAEEEVDVLAVGNDGLVNGTSAGLCLGESTGVQSLVGRPAVGVGRVAGGPVAEGGGAPLVSEDPDVLRGEEEEGRSNGVGVHAVLSDGTHLRPVAEETEVHGAIAVAGVVVGRVDKVLALVGSNSEILKVDPAILQSQVSTVSLTSHWIALFDLVPWAERGHQKTTSGTGKEVGRFELRRWRRKPAERCWKKGTSS